MSADKAQSSILSSVEGCGLRRYGLFGGACFDAAQHAHIVLAVNSLEKGEDYLGCFGCMQPKPGPKDPKPDKPDSGIFITIEGIEGSGKTTLALLIGEQIAGAGRRVVITAEPGGCAIGEMIREIVLHSEEPISDKAELLLFEAARAQHVDAVIRPALEAGSVVICDRFADSSLAYQGYARGLDLEEIASLNVYATSGLVPDITILLDLPAEAGLARQSKIDRISSRDVAFHESVRKGFLALAEAEPDRFLVIDATQNIDSVLAAALAGIGRLFSSQR